MVYRQALEQLSEAGIIQESPYTSAIFPDFAYYAVHPALAKPRGICWYVDPIGKTMQYVSIICRNGKHYIYIKLYGDTNAYSPADLFETYEDAIEECMSRNRDRNVHRLLDVDGKEILYQEALAAIAR